MALSDHFRELRARVLKVALTFLVVFVVSLFFFDPLFDFVYGPYEEALKNLPDGKSLATTSGAGGGLMLYLKLCGFTAVLVTCPVWLYQIWAFIMPGLHPSEKRWTQIFVVIAVPLFLVGVVLGWLTLPKGLEVLIGFNPDVITNILDFNDYLQFFTRTLLVFGLAFEIPVFVVMLNRAGVVKGKTLAQYRPWIIIGIFVFAAIATPSTDPFTMTIMAVPMVILYGISEVMARVHDRRKASRLAECRPVTRRGVAAVTDDLASVDPFDLPEWLGVAEVTWSARAGLRTGYAVPGDLHAEGHETIACDLLGVDEAYPVPIAADEVRLRAHQAWRNGEVHLVRRDGRLALSRARHVLHRRPGAGRVRAARPGGGGLRRPIHRAAPDR